MRRKKTLYSNLSNIGERGAARVKLNNRLFSDKNFLEFANCIINSFFYSGKKYKFNALLRSCSISLKRVVGLNFIQCLYLVYFRLLPFIAIRAKQASNYNASVNKSSFTYKSQSIRLRQVFLLSWFKKSVHERVENRLEERIVGEILDIIHNKGKSVSLKKNYYKFVSNEAGVENVKKSD